jgi:hypothetical protein
MNIFQASSSAVDDPRPVETAFKTLAGTPNRAGVLDDDSLCSNPFYVAIS